MNTVMYIYIDALCTSIIILHFISILNRTRFINNSLSNLKVGSSCFLTMMSTIYLGNNRLYSTQRIILVLLTIAFMVLAYHGTLTGYVGLLLVVPFLLIRIRHA